MKARSIWLFCRLPPRSRRSYSPLPIVRAFIRRSRLGLSVCCTFRYCSASLALPTTRTTTPSADFCAAIREPCDSPSPLLRTRRRPPEVSLASFNARPPDLQPRRLMDMDFVVLCPLVPSRLPRIRFLSIGPHLRYGFLQTPPRGDALASCLPFTSIRLGEGPATPSDQTRSAHQSGDPRLVPRVRLRVANGIRTHDPLDHNQVL